MVEPGRDWNTARKRRRVTVAAAREVEAIRSDNENHTSCNEAHVTCDEQVDEISTWRLDEPIWQGSWSSHDMFDSRGLAESEVFVAVDCIETAVSVFQQDLRRSWVSRQHKSGGSGSAAVPTADTAALAGHTTSNRHGTSGNHNKKSDNNNSLSGFVLFYYRCCENQF